MRASTLSARVGSWRTSTCMWTWNFRGRVRHSARVPPAHEQPEAAAGFSDARDVGGIAARPRVHRDGVRPQAVSAGWRARVLLPGGPRADARLSDRQDRAVSDGLRGRTRAREGTAADAG